MRCGGNRANNKTRPSSRPCNQYQQNAFLGQAKGSHSRASRTKTGQRLQQQQNQQQSQRQQLLQQQQQKHQSKEEWWGLAEEEDELIKKGGSKEKAKTTGSRSTHRATSTWIISAKPQRKDNVVNVAVDRTRNRSALKHNECFGHDLASSSGSHRLEPAKENNGTDLDEVYTFVELIPSVVDKLTVEGSE